MGSRYKISWAGERGGFDVKVHDNMFALGPRPI